MLEGFALDILNAVGHLGNGGNGGEMLKQLVGQGKGKTGVVLGNGPSLKRAVMFLDGDDHIYVAVNNAVQTLPKADIWLCAESEIHRRSDWFWEKQKYGGLCLLDASMVLQGLVEDNETRRQDGRPYYDEDFMGRALFFLRGGLDGATTGPPEAFRSFDDGLFQYLPLVEVDGPEIASMYEHGELYGSGALPAIHLLAGMGCDTIHLFGCELSWNKDEPQHADGLETFTESGEPVNRPMEYNGLITTPYFLHSARAIRWYARQAGIEIVNHSGGLLDIIE